MTQKSKTRKKKREETTIMVWHLWQAKMVYLKADAMYAEIGGTKVISCQSETTKTIRTGKIRKIHKIQTILRMHMETKMLQTNLRQIIPTTTYLAEDQNFKESSITAESGNIEEKSAGFLKTISSETLKEPTYVCQYYQTYHKTEFKKK